MTRLLAVRLGSTLYDAVVQRAVREDRPVSWVVRKALEQYVGSVKEAEGPELSQRQEAIRKRVARMKQAEPQAPQPGLLVTPGTRRCPKCGCVESMHRAGAKHIRCERHPTCLWSEVPGEDADVSRRTTGDDSVVQRDTASDDGVRRYTRFEEPA